MPLIPSFVYWSQGLHCLLGYSYRRGLERLTDGCHHPRHYLHGLCGSNSAVCVKQPPLTVSEHRRGARAVRLRASGRRTQVLPCKKTRFPSSTNPGMVINALPWPRPPTVCPPSPESWSRANEEEDGSAQHHADCSRNWQETGNSICEETECQLNSIQQIFIELPSGPGLF